MSCPACGTAIDPSLPYCRQCGASLGKLCGRCGTSNPPDANFCGRCAARLRTPSRPLEVVGRRPDSAFAPASERRQLSVLFCDVVSSSTLSESLDPEDLRDVLRAYQARCSEVVRRLGGYVAQYLGDGLLVYFGYPVAHEDAAQCAVLAGLQMVAAVGSLDLGTHARVQLSVRVGIHTGTAVVGEMGHGARRELLAVGETPNLAARVQAAASPDAVVISDATFRLIEGYFRCRELGPRALKGFSQPVPLYEVIEASGARSRLEKASGKLTPLVDREQERAILFECWAQVAAGAGLALALCGEAGLGKSRLALALRKALPATSTILVCHCSHLFESTALHPIIEMIERDLGLSAELPAAERLARIEMQLTGVGLDATHRVAPLAQLLSIPLTDPYAAPPHMTPQRERQSWFEVLIDWLAASARRQPMLLLFEDVHWADPSTLELLTLLLSRDCPGLMLLLTHRPELKASWSEQQVKRLELTRLSAADSAAIVGAVAQSVALAPEEIEELRAKGDGVPLFLEEMTKAVIEHNASRQKPDPTIDGAGARRSSTIPPTLQDSLNARLDRLGSAKPVLQLAALLGRSFSFELLCRVSRQEPELLLGVLDRLVDAGLLFPRADDTYAFKHALIQDTAYDSLLRSTRQQYHREILAALREHFPAVAAGQPELLARHCAGGGLAEEAALQWGLAGANALSRCAYVEAIQACQQGLEQLAMLAASPQRDLQEIGLRTTLGLALIFTCGYSAREVEENYDRAQQLCERSGDVPIGVLYGVWGVYLVRADREVTQKLAVRLEQLAASSSDPFVLRLAYSTLGVRAFYLGELERADALLARARALCDLSRDTPAEIEREFGLELYLYPFMYGAWTLLLRGLPEQAMKTWEPALAFAERLQHPNGLAISLGFGSMLVSECVGDTSQALALGARELQLAHENGLPFWLAAAQIHCGVAHSRGGQPELAIGELGAALSLLQAMGGYVLCPAAQVALIEASLAAGRDAEASAALADALRFNEGKLADCFRPPLLRLKAELLWRAGEPEAAEGGYRESIALARRQGARIHELRGEMALARLLKERGRAAEARASLAALHACFGEGHAMADLRAAQQLLDELA